MGTQRHNKYPLKPAVIIIFSPFLFFHLSFSQSRYPSNSFTMSTSLDQLKATGTVVVSDSGDFASIAKYQPQDATTNPSLILAASKKPEYAKLIDRAVEYGKGKGGDIDSKVDAALDRLLVESGKEILNIIPGKVS